MRWKYLIDKITLYVEQNASDLMNRKQIHMNTNNMEIDCSINNLEKNVKTKNEIINAIGQKSIKSWDNKLIKVKLYYIYVYWLHRLLFEGQISIY